MEPMPEILVWEEIVLPQPPPTDDGIGWLLWLGVVLLGLLTAAGWYRHQRPPRKARRAIKRLEKQIRHDPRRCRQYLHELRACLRRARGTNRLDAITGGEQWQQYLALLTYHSFAPETPSAETTLQLTQQAFEWLEVQT